MRIAMVLPSMSVAGMEVLVLGLSRHLIARGHHVEILCTEYIGGLEARIRAAGVPVEVASAAGLATIVNPGILAQRMRDGRFDIVHSHSGVTAKAARAALMAGVPGVVNTLHGFAHGWGMVDHVMQAVGCAQTDVIVGCSADTTAYLRRLLPGLQSRIHLVRNGIDVEHFSERAQAPGLRAELGLPASARVIGSVARLDPIKNQQLMVDALVSLPPEWHLVIVGDGPARASLEAHVAARGMASRVHLVGVRNVNIETYEAFDVFALSSRSEAMPMTILEAFAAGVPVVASAVGGIPTLLHDGRTGVLFAPDDAAALAAAAQQVVSGDAANAARVEAARQQLHASHTLTVMTAEYERLYAKAIARRATRA